MSTDSTPASPATPATPAEPASPAEDVAAVEAAPPLPLGEIKFPPNMPESMKQRIVDAMRNGQQVSVDQGGNVIVGSPNGPNPGNVRPITGAPKKPNKADIKRFQQRQERMKRWLNKPENKGKTEKDAHEAITMEDWNSAPPEHKIARLVQVTAAIQQQMQLFGNDLMNLRYNDQNIGDAFDINYRSISRMFRHLGITPEMEKQFMQDAQAEFLVEREAEQKLQEENAKKASQLDSLAAQDPVAAKLVQELEKSGDNAKRIPDGAEVFGETQQQIVTES